MDLHPWTLHFLLEMLKWSSFFKVGGQKKVLLINSQWSFTKFFSLEHFLFSFSVSLEEKMASHIQSLIENAEEALLELNTYLTNVSTSTSISTAATKVWISFYFLIKFEKLLEYLFYTLEKRTSENILGQTIAVFKKNSKWV